MVVNYIPMETTVTIKEKYKNIPMITSKCIECNHKMTTSFEQFIQYNPQCSKCLTTYSRFVTKVTKIEQLKPILLTHMLDNHGEPEEDNYLQYIQLVKSNILNTYPTVNINRVIIGTLLDINKYIVDLQHDTQLNKVFTEVEQW